VRAECAGFPAQVPEERLPQASVVHRLQPHTNKQTIESQAGGPKTKLNNPRCDAVRPALAVLLQLLGRTLRRFFQPEFQKYRDLACRLLEDDYELALEIIEHVRQPADTPAPAPAPATAMRV
jgi:hypothetical protein